MVFAADYCDLEHP